jgi:hypothetical protein
MLMGSLPAADTVMATTIPNIRHTFRAKNPVPKRELAILTGVCPAIGRVASLVVGSAADAATIRF